MAEVEISRFFSRLPRLRKRAILDGWRLINSDGCCVLQMFRKVRKSIIRDLSALEMNSGNIHLIEREESISCIPRKTSGDL